MFIVFGQPDWLSEDDGTYHVEFLEEVVEQVVIARDRPGGFEDWLDTKARKLDPKSIMNDNMEE